MRHVLGVLVLLISCSYSFSQVPTTTIVKKYTQKDGLSSYNIRKITQDEWGFVWVATQDGLHRFDGMRFLRYSKNSLPSRKLCGSEVREILEDSTQNVVWALSSEGGIDAISTVTTEVVRTIPIPNAGKEEYNLSMVKIRDELWVGTSTGVQVFNAISGRFVQHLPLPDNQASTIDFATRSLHRDEYGNIWICYGGYGIVIYHPATKAMLKSIPLSELGSSIQTREVRIPHAVFIPGGQAVLATSQGLRTIQYDAGYRTTVNAAPCQGLPVLNQENIDWLIQTGTSMMVSGYNGLYQFDLALRQYQLLREVPRTNESNWLSSVLCMYPDKAGNLWLGCQEGLGYVRRSSSPFIPYSFDPITNTKLDHVFAVSPIADNRILVGLRNGLVEINRTSGRYVHFDKGHLYQHIFKDVNGYVHVSRPDGLFIYRQGKISPVHTRYPEFSPYVSYSINSHLRLSDTLILLGTENNKGLLVWNPVKKQVRSLDIQTKPALAASIVNNLYRDKRGRIWVLSDNVITILSSDLSLSKEVVVREQASGQPYRLFFDMCEVNGSYWIASYGSGLLRLDDRFHVKQVITTQQGLSDDGVYQLYALAGPRLLVTSNNGLSRIDLSTRTIHRYYQNDGLHANAFEEVSGVQMNGKIYAGGVNGFTVIEPERFADNRVPPILYATGVDMKTADRQTAVNNLLLKNVTIPSHVIQSTIHFTGLNFENPERTEYAYRLIEESPNWIHNGSQATLPLINHPPGQYTLEVKAANEEGIWSEPIRLDLYFQPKWYQTWWFKLFIMTLALGGIYQMYRFRINQLQHEQTIRTRLARDLHDDLGSTLNSIHVYTNLAMMESSTNRYLLNIKQGTLESLTSIRDIIWILDDQKDTIGQLAERINQFASPLCEANGSLFSLSTDSSLNDAVLGKEEKRNLYMILKEAVNNSVKYAESKQISLAFARETGQLMICISDTGNGFDLHQTRRGNGLSNMERRADEIKYHFTITSAIGGGTTIKLRKM